MFVRFRADDKGSNGLGQSFKALNRYLVSGKKDEHDPNRLLWAEGVNVHGSDPLQAWAEMAFTAENQVALKQDAKRRGLLAKNARVNDKEETPVWHAVLSWEPSDKPTRARMMEAAKSFMEFHGLAGHQFAVFAHGDGAAPHLHIMANLIDPETGRSAKSNLTRVTNGRHGLQMRSSDWADQWEAAHPDETPCPERRKNWEQRRENAKEWTAFKVLAAANTAFGAEVPPAPVLKKAYDRSPKRHLWQAARDIRRDLNFRLQGRPDAAKIADRAAQRYAQVHRQEWAKHFMRSPIAPVRWTFRGMVDGAWEKMGRDLAKSLGRLVDLFTKAADRPTRLRVSHEIAAHNRVLARVRERPQTPPPSDQLEAQQIGAVMRQATRDQSTFTRGQLAKTVAGSLGPHHTPEQFQAFLAKVEASPELVRIATEKGELLTTRTMYDTETRLLGNGIIMAGSKTHAVPASVLAAIEQRAGWLTEEQKTALAHITAPAALSAVVGVAGAGKSTIMKFAHEAWKAAGYEVRGVVYSGLVAQALQSDTGITSQTFAAFRRGIEAGTITLGPKSVVLVDEAGMLGSQQMAWLLETARAAGAKVPLVGDYQQLQAIEAGGALRLLVEEPTIGAARLSGVMRQGAHVRHDPAQWAAYEWQRQATRDFAQGRAQKALAAYDAQGHVKGHDSREDARAAVVSAWLADMQKPGTSSVIIAATRAEVAALNREARQRMIAAGLVKGAGREIDATEQRGEAAPVNFKLALGVGERLMFTKNDKRVTNDPMEAHYIGFNMWVKAVEKAGATDPDKVIAALPGTEQKNLTGGTAKMLPNHHITKPVFIGEIKDDGQFDVVFKTEELIPGEAWSKQLEGSKDLEADWVTRKCGNYNTKTKKCGGA